MNILQLQTNYISSANPSDNVNLYSSTTGNILAGAAATTLFNINAKSISLGAALTSHNGNISVGANTISNPSFVLTGNVGNVAGANLTFGVASSSGSYSTSATTGDVVIRSSGANNLLLQTGQGTAAIKIDSSNNVNVANYLLLNSTTTDNLRAGTGSGSYFYINNVGTIGYNSTWSITNNGIVTASYINVSDTINWSNAGGIVYMKEGYGLNIHGASQQPVKIPDASLIVGLSPVGSSYYGSGYIYCNNLNVGTLSTTSLYTTILTGTTNLNYTNASNNKMLILFDQLSTESLNTGTNFYGLGINSSTLRFQTPSTGCYYSFYMGSNSTPSFQIQTAGCYVNGFIVNTSDYRIKSNVKPIEKTIDNLRPVSYFNKNTEKESHGFIAHEVAEYFPELVVGEKDAVDEKGEPKYQSLDYIGLIAVLTREIQAIKTKGTYGSPQTPPLNNITLNFSYKQIIVLISFGIIEFCIGIILGKLIK